MNEKVLYLSKGSAEILDAKRLDPEIVQIKVNGKKQLCYVGVIPSLVTSKRPGMLGWLQDHIGQPYRQRLHIVRDIEPFARDAYTGKMMDPEKKYRVCLHRGIIDEHGNILHKPEKKSPIDKKTKEPLTEDQLKAYDKKYEKFMEKYQLELITYEDVSDISYILEDVELLRQTKTEQNMIIAARKSFVSARDITMWMCIIGGFLFPIVFTWIVVDGDIFKYFANPVPLIKTGVNHLWTGFKALRFFKGS